MNVLVTGAPGWLANRFLEVLVRGWNNEGPPNDWNLRCLVQEGVPVASLEALSRVKPIALWPGDLLRPETLREPLGGIDVVFHIAGLIHPRRVAELYAVNTQGTRNLLDAA